MRARCSRSWFSVVETGLRPNLMRKLLRKQGCAPKRVLTDKLRSYGAAFQHLGLSCHYEQGLRQKTIGPKTRNKWCDGASARCNASNQRHRRNVPERARRRP
jgi:transposase-like protein